MHFKTVAFAVASLAVTKVISAPIENRNDLQRRDIGLEAISQSLETAHIARGRPLVRGLRTRQQSNSNSNSRSRSNSRGNSNSPSRSRSRRDLLVKSQPLRRSGLDARQNRSISSGHSNSRSVSNGRSVSSARSVRSNVRSVSSNRSNSNGRSVSRSNSRGGAAGAQVARTSARLIRRSGGLKARQNRSNSNGRSNSAGRSVSNGRSNSRSNSRGRAARVANPTGRVIRRSVRRMKARQNRSNSNGRSNSPGRSVSNRRSNSRSNSRGRRTRANGVRRGDAPDVPGANIAKRDVTAEHAAARRSPAPAVVAIGLSTVSRRHVEEAMQKRSDYASLAIDEIGIREVEDVGGLLKRSYYKRELD